MEELWNDINLSSLNQHYYGNNNNNNTTHNHQTTFHFQDFISEPPSKFDPPSLTSTTAATTNDTSSRDLASKTRTTNRSLSNSVSLAHQTNNKKRARCNNGHTESCDQRHKRLMKSRESADRSRARKQVYMNELEQKVAKLKKENAGLKNQLTQFYLATPVEVPKKPTLYRTLTAPF